ncbi:hypothetical protein Cylst_1951 [Cylindrospermum stagnale PCC 7417]|uniref:Uncharacterized protein n=1 Tax=Cylindrospermum stagnale PCC 7417 TaxID=56107 RepID=K9WXG6_9NOST|nr:hypothetical protein Cylst_1951 [Cylindrospermum stagnale PCC 7417]
MSNRLYLLQRLIDQKTDSGGFYAFSFKSKERVVKSTRSFNILEEFTILKKLLEDV